MRILGLSLSPHDSSAAIVEDGVVSVAIEEEKLSRIRHCIKYDDSKYILESEAEYFDTNFLNPPSAFISEKISLFKKYFKMTNRTVRGGVDMVVGSNLLGTVLPDKNYTNINHHLAHAAHAFYTSPYSEAAVLVVDGSGDCSNGAFETVSMYLAKGNRLQLVENVSGKIKHETNTIIALSNSIGVLYQNTSVLCGFGAFGEGKMMGLASYGVPRYAKDFNNYCKKRGSYFEIDNLGLYKHIKVMIEENSDKNVIADITSSVQSVVNDMILFYAKRLKEITNQENLCYAGGVALNATANTILLEKSGFKHIYIPSAPGDSGASIGAALYGYYGIAKNQRNANSVIISPYLGNLYDEKIVKKALRKYAKKIVVKKLGYKELSKIVAKLIFENKTIAWFQGRSEFGPRALGNRSILANPIYESNKDRLNIIKNRESFRPVAPVIMSEHLNCYFSQSSKAIADSLPYMLFTLPPINMKVSKMIPAVIHVDGTSRLQSVSETQNALLHDLVKEFAIISKVPVLINTSFNINGEPMVETPDDALRTFIASDLDYLVLNNHLIKKHEQ